MPVLYSLDDSINEFFEAQSVTRQQCDEIAISLVGGDITPAAIQGAFSYTVATGSKVVQFRNQSSILDMKIMALAQAIHGPFVPDCVYHGDVGPLSVYVIDKLPGATYIEARCMSGHSIELSAEERSRQANTVSDFARFFVASWNNKQEQVDKIEAIHHEYQQKLQLLTRTLPIRFSDSLMKLQAELPLIFSSSYPMVLNHDDLCEMNIFVDPDTGHITGIIDWADAKIVPFGIALWGLENMLGFMDSKGWHYYTNHRELNDLFWHTFERVVGGLSEDKKRAIRVARMVGFFLRYGFEWEDGTTEVPVKESNSNMAYLDAFCLESAQYTERGGSRMPHIYTGPGRKDSIAS